MPAFLSEVIVEARVGAFDNCLLIDFSFSSGSSSFVDSLV